jgi:hypothetical protein
MTGAQFEISIDGVPRTYRDQKDIALLATQTLKSRNPNSVLKLRDLKTGEEIIIAFKADATIAECSRCRSGRSPDWLKVKNPAARVVKREAEVDWGR